ncbi:MAG: hypothetical protein JW862_05115 [Anaerolineales bacterium]|nr:hypothetical protein [Anaerolineales bacterium]
MSRPQSSYDGTNLETGKKTFGYLDWREKEWDMHLCLCYDIQEAGWMRGFLVLGEELFSRWP